MRYSLIISICLFIFFSGCSKDKFDTVPELIFTSVNTTELRKGSVLQFNLSFTDKEGDISNSIFVEKTSPECPDNNFTQSYFLADFPSVKNQKGEIQVSFGYNVEGFPNIPPTCAKNENAIFRFVLKDKAGNVSDTVSSPRITLVY